MRFREFVEGTPKLTVPTGGRGPAWADLQKALIALGYDLPVHGVDGYSGPETSSAIKKFEADNKLTQNGSPDDEMIQLMNKIIKDKGIKFDKSTEADVVAGKGGYGKVRSGSNSRIDPESRRKALASVANLGPTASARDATAYFISKGWTPAQAAGIVGNLQAESGRNLDINAVGDGGKAYGIAQWHPDRQQNFARVFGKDIKQSSLGEQLAFVQWELENTERRAGQMLSTAKTSEEAAIIFDKYYERSAGLHTDRRVALAKALDKSNTNVG
jgi:peptidoglycan hydrolase-like protein with peptidoglycan-binding domain